MVDFTTSRPLLALFQHLEQHHFCAERFCCFRCPNECFDSRVLVEQAAAWMSMYWSCWGASTAESWFRKLREGACTWESRRDHWNRIMFFVLCILFYYLQLEKVRPCTPPKPGCLTRCDASRQRTLKLVISSKPDHSKWKSRKFRGQRLILSPSPFLAWCLVGILIAAELKRLVTELFMTRTKAFNPLHVSG